MLTLSRSGLPGKSNEVQYLDVLPGWRCIAKSSQGYTQKRRRRRLAMCWSCTFTPRKMLRQSPIVLRQPFVRSAEKGLADRWGFKREGMNSFAKDSDLSTHWSYCPPLRRRGTILEDFLACVFCPANPFSRTSDFVNPIDSRPKIQKRFSAGLPADIFSQTLQILEKQASWHGHAARTSTKNSCLKNFWLMFRSLEISTLSFAC